MRAFVVELEYHRDLLGVEPGFAAVAATRARSTSAPARLGST